MTRLAIALVAATLLGAAPAALAQGGAPGGGAGRGGAVTQERMMSALFAGITLTAEQQARVKAVGASFEPRLAKARETMMAARQAGQPMAPEAMQGMRALQAEQRDSLRAVLTPEQRAQFDRNGAAMPQGRGMGRGMGRGSRPPRG